MQTSILSPNDRAEKNHDDLRTNNYFGRVVILGTTSKHMVQVYGISGRSAGSRNRGLKIIGNHSLEVVVADPSKERGDPALTIYPAMVAWNGYHIVSNGQQSDTLFEEISRGNTEMTLGGVKHEPDKPNYTCRITGVSQWGTFRQRFIIHRRADHAMPGVTPEAILCEKSYFERGVPASGFGHYVTTYMGDAPSGMRLPPFEGEPRLIRLPDTGDEILEHFWKVMDGPHRVALGVKLVSLHNSQDVTMLVRNQYEIVA